ncbi:MAG TPA: molybdate ABC transporter substrate-binding protein [bacterium]
MRRVAALAAVLLAVCVVTGTAESAVTGTADLQVAAASDLRFALTELKARFERVHPARVRLTLGSSGQLAAQIAQGAPFDVFFSANEAFVRTLADRGAIRRDSIRLYAIGRIVLWVRSASAIDPAQGLGVLTAQAVRFVAIANPVHAPYGLAAEQALKSAGVYDRVSAKLVLGENISQTLQFVQTGNADAGIIALSLAIVPAVKNTGRYWLIPSSLHRPIRQAVGVTTRSRQAPLARAFLGFVNSTEGREILRRYGFALAGESL